MNRIDRQYAIHEELRRRQPTGVTAARLAKDLEVSVRTIKRDISALQQSGSPIWAQPGPGGGYVLAGRASLPPVNFTATQAVAVSVALAAMSSTKPFGPDARAAANKIRDALDHSEHSKARELAERIWVLHEVLPSRPSSRVLRAVEQSLVDHVQLSLQYESASGDVTSRVVEPAMLARGVQQWYLVAFCQLRDKNRWFRLDRIRRATLTKRPYVPQSIKSIGEAPELALSVESHGQLT